MKRSAAMVLSGAFSILVVLGATIVVAQTGLFTGSSTLIQPHGEIIVPEMTPTVAQTYTIVVTRTIVITPRIEPSSTVISTASNPTPTEYETELLTQLNQAYALLRQREEIYQVKLREAYDRIAALSKVNTSQVQPAQPSSPTSPTSITTTISSLNKSSNLAAQSQPQLLPTLQATAQPTAVQHGESNKDHKKPPPHDGGNSPGTNQELPNVGNQ